MEELLSGHRLADRLPMILCYKEGAGSSVSAADKLLESWEDFHLQSQST